MAVFLLAMSVWQATARSALELQGFTAKLITYTVCECGAPEWEWMAVNDGLKGASERFGDLAFLDSLVVTDQ